MKSCKCCTGVDRSKAMRDHDDVRFAYDDIDPAAIVNDKDLQDWMVLPNERLTPEMLEFWREIGVVD